jgi:hypothetical protein
VTASFRATKTHLATPAFAAGSIDAAVRIYSEVIKVIAHSLDVLAGLVVHYSSIDDWQVLAVLIPLRKKGSQAWRWLQVQR